MKLFLRMGPDASRTDWEESASAASLAPYAGPALDARCDRGWRPLGRMSYGVRWSWD